MKSSHFFLIVFVIACPVWAQYGGGAGTPQDPYLIISEEHLNSIGSNTADYDKHFKLVNNLDMSGYDGNDGRPAFNVIGYYNSNQDYAYFCGTFDGNSHTISNLTIPQNNQNMAMFGAAAAESVIRNVVLHEVYSVSAGAPTPANSVGGLLALSNGTVENCSVTGMVSGGFDVGGLVAYAAGGTIADCASAANVSGISYVGSLVGFATTASVLRSKANGNVNVSNGPAGGFIGMAMSSTISECVSAGQVAGTGDNIGGFCGSAGAGTLIDKCYSTGNVLGDMSSNSASVGGFLGENNQAVTQNCFSTGNVTGKQNVGGFAGLITTSQSAAPSTITNCYSAGSVQGVDNVGGFLGVSFWNTCTVNQSFFDSTNAPSLPAVGYIEAGIVQVDAQTTEQMKTQSTFTASGWDFTGVWRMCVDGVKYPHLKFVYSAIGDFICPDGVRFSDFALLAEKWLMDACGSASGYCDGVDIDRSGTVDKLDLLVFTDNWLSEL
jgi:hypothetical protein